MTEHPNTAWPTLPAGDWIDTIEAVHLWSQIVGKIRLGYSPWLNHSWRVPLYAGAEDPDATLESFFDTTHAAAAELGEWDRENLECDHPEGPDWWQNRPHQDS